MAVEMNEVAVAQLAQLRDRRDRGEAIGVCDQERLRVLELRAAYAPDPSVPASVSILYSDPPAVHPITGERHPLLGGELDAA